MGFKEMLGFGKKESRFQTGSGPENEHESFSTEKLKENNDATEGSEKKVEEAAVPEEEIQV